MGKKRVPGVASRATPDGNSSSSSGSQQKSVAEWFAAARKYMTQDRRLLVGITFIAFCTRFYSLFWPNAVVFDEFHFGKFVNNYNTGFYFFDIHPPLGKLTMYWIGRVFGYDAKICKYDNIHDVYADDCRFMILRYTAATFGVAIVPLIYWTARELGARPWGAFLAAAFLSMDSLQMIEARLILTDSQLLFYCALALYVGIRYFKRWNEHIYAEQLKAAMSKGHKGVADHMARQLWLSEYDDLDSKDPQNPRLMTFADRVKWAFYVGVTCGLAVSVKWTGLATPGILALECLLGVFFLRRAVPFFDMIVMAVWAFIPYAFWFWAHFLLLPYSGEGDDFMQPDFRRTLIGNPIYDPNAHTQAFLRSFWELNTEMLAANARIDVPHQWMSKWHTWPVNLRGILYWSRAEADGRHSQVYLLANPLVSWSVLAFVVLFVAFAAAYLRFRHPLAGIKFGGDVHRFMATGAFCLSTFTLNLLPYILVSRAAFLYHYLPGLYYAQLIAALFVDKACGDYIAGAARAVFVVLCFGYYYFFPWIYGLPMTSEEHQDRRWLASWD